MKNTPESFFEVNTIHSAQINWWWTDKALHDADYHIKVYDALNLAVKDSEIKFDVKNHTGYCCQSEGLQLDGTDLNNVKNAALAVTKVLMRFKGIVSI